MKVALYIMMNRVLSKLGVLVIPARELVNRNRLVNDYALREHDLLRLNESCNGGLRRYLLENGKTRWLEIGCGGTLEDGFHYIDIFPEGIVDRSFRSNYSRIDIVDATAADLERLGQFDLIRMQHVFEHFAPEDGRRVLEKCGSLLSSGGFLLISTPDLRVHARIYLNGGYKENPRIESFNICAYKRILKDAPDSFYFSMFAHSLLYEKHLWCYDFEGLKYLLDKADLFEDIQEIGFEHPFASFPFTHNRPEEDVCVLARRR
jgi:predicted SAM-dependent methyltransferase